MLLVDILFHSAMFLIFCFLVFRQSLYQLAYLDQDAYEWKTYFVKQKAYVSTSRVIALLFMMTSYMIYFLMNNVIGFLLTMLALIGMLTVYGIETQKISLKFNPLIKSLFVVDVIIYLVAHTLVLFLSLNMLFFFGFIYLVLLPILIVIKTPLYKRIYQKMVKDEMSKLTEHPHRVLIIGDASKALVKHFLCLALEKTYTVSKNSNHPNHMYDFLIGLPPASADILIIDCPDDVPLDLIPAKTYIICGPVSDDIKTFLTSIHQEVLVISEDQSLPLMHHVTYGLDRQFDYHLEAITYGLPESTYACYHKDEKIEEVHIPLCHPNHLSALSATYACLKALNLDYRLDLITLPEGKGRMYRMDEDIILDLKHTTDHDERMRWFEILSKFSIKKVLITETLSHDVQDARNLWIAEHITKVYMIKTTQNAHLSDLIAQLNITIESYDSFEQAFETIILSPSSKEQLIIIDVFTHL